MADPITYTPNLRLAQPPAGRQNWSALANVNWQAIDSAISTFFQIQNYTGPWTNSTPYVVSDVVLDPDLGGFYICHVAHNSAAAPTTFAEDRTTNPSYWSAYSSAGTARGTWTSNTVYSSGDFVVNGSQYAVCIVSHTSSASFSSDVALGKWAILIDFSLIGTQPLPVLTGAADANKFVVTAASGLSYTITDAFNARVLLGATTVGHALFGAGSAASARSTIGITVAMDAVVTASTTVAALNALDGGAVGISLFLADTVGQVNAILGITTGTVAVGNIFTHPVSTPPAGYLLCNGQAVSRASYPALFTLIGTTYGVGDGVTTFNLPNVPAEVVETPTGTFVTMYKVIKM